MFSGYRVLADVNKVNAVNRFNAIIKITADNLPCFPCSLAASDSSVRARGVLSGSSPHFHFTSSIDSKSSPVRKVWETASNCWVSNSVSDLGLGGLLPIGLQRQFAKCIRDNHSHCFSLKDHVSIKNIFTKLATFKQDFYLGLVRKLHYYIIATDL